MYDKVLCSGMSMDGSRCTRHHTPGSQSCRWHSAESVEDRARKLEQQAALVRSTAIPA